jgi:hypothetical protein
MIELTSEDFNIIESALTAYRRFITNQIEDEHICSGEFSPEHNKTLMKIDGLRARIFRNRNNEVKI